MCICVCVCVCVRVRVRVRVRVCARGTAEVPTPLQRRPQGLRQEPAAGRRHEPLRQHEERRRRHQELQVLRVHQLAGHHGPVRACLHLTDRRSVYSLQTIEIKKNYSELRPA